LQEQQPPPPKAAALKEEGSKHSSKHWQPTMLEAIAIKQGKLIPGINTAIYLATVGQSHINMCIGMA
jgi:hypothetical protein